MTYQQRVALDELMRGAPLDMGGEVPEQRAIFDQLVTAQPVAGDVVASSTDLEGVPVVDVSIPGLSGQRTLLYFHGGGYALGSAASAVGLASDLARHTRARAIAVDYRLAPEHPFPAAVEDAVTAYRALLGEGVSSARIAFAGESAGGGLVTAALVALRERDLSQPRCAAVLSPWADLSLGGESINAKASLDPTLTSAGLRRRAREYLAGADPRTPLASPIFADLTGLPPLLIQAGSHEILLDDAVRLAARAAACDVEITLEVTPRVPHVFQGFAALLDEGEAALARVGHFLNRHFASSDPRTPSPRNEQGRVTPAGAEKRRS